MARSSVPMIMPILSPGRHRSPRQGACFMEFASYLAGDKWSDHPSCTHPLLATLARDVNDLTTDAARERLLPLVHRVVGLTSDDPLLASTLLVRVTAAAMPVASMERQRALAAGLLGRLPHIDSPQLHAMATDALAFSPGARTWAEKYVATFTPPRTSRRGADESMIHTATVGIALACYSPDELGADERLEMLLAGAIDDAEIIAGVRKTPAVRELLPTA